MNDVRATRECSRQVLLIIEKWRYRDMVPEALAHHDHVTDRVDNSRDNPGGVYSCR